MTPTEAAYVAAIIDGEGCISAWTDTFTKRSRRYTRHCCYVHVTNTSEALVRWLVSVAGGTVAGHPATGKRCYRWRLFRCDDLRRVLPQVIPFMVIKPRQAELAVRFHSLGDWPSEDRRAERLRIIDAMQSLNS